MLRKELFIQLIIISKIFVKVFLRFSIILLIYDFFISLNNNSII